VLSIRGKIKRSLISAIEAGITKVDDFILVVSTNFVCRKVLDDLELISQINEWMLVFLK
jgi:hypothetical protein